MVLGLMAAIAMISFGGARQGAEDQKDRRNAQEITSVAGMASAAGAAFIVPGDEKASIVNLRDGVSPTKGAFRGRLFKIGAMGDAEITGAMRFIVMSGDELRYNTTLSQ
ncbi:type II secretory pathway pseudopilin PulG [Prosthecobacter vanneervenii]|uniref:Type II secretory pathway pseudopilin PulG n=2 Tax=Prosthecobacter vanneervenii TaxID=48466 RepID=A0A7W7YAE5_9BACT|nr:type II secretory pathway pseudopilin PulG [Prosthecobacter vanneervenii]